MGAASPGPDRGVVRGSTPGATRRGLLSGLMLMALAAGLSGCGGSSGAGLAGDPAPASSVTTSTVVAEERRITSVLTLDAFVVVNPFIRIAAPESGVLVLMSKGRVGIIPDSESEPVPVALPDGAEIISLLVKPGTRVTEGLPIINAQYTGMAMQATILPEQIYRLYGGIISAKAQVNVGPGPFDTSVLGVPYPVGAITLPDASLVGAASLSRSASPSEAALLSRPGLAGVSLSSAPALSANVAPAIFHPGQARLITCDESSWDDDDSAYSIGPSSETSSFPVVTSSPPDYSAGVVVIVRAPADLHLIEGMPGRVALVTAESTGVALPIAAVAGISEKGQVYVVATDGSVKLRDVTLGITDGSYVEITSGLAAGEVVQMPSPSIVTLSGSGN